MKFGPLDILGQDDETELTRAVKNGDINTVRSLIQQGANVNVPGKLGNTPLHYALQQKNEQMRVDMFYVLRQAGADVDLIADLALQKDPQRAIKISPRQMATLMELTDQLRIPPDYSTKPGQPPLPPQLAHLAQGGGQAAVNRPPPPSHQPPPPSPLEPATPPPAIPGQDRGELVYSYYHYGDGSLKSDLLSRLTEQELNKLISEFASQQGLKTVKGGQTWGAANYDFLFQEQQRRRVPQQPMQPTTPPPAIPGQDRGELVYSYYHYGDGSLKSDLLSRLTEQELNKLISEFASQQGLKTVKGGQTWGAANYDFLFQEQQRRRVPQQPAYPQQPASSQQHAQYGQAPQPQPAPQYPQQPASSQQHAQYGQQPQQYMPGQPGEARKKPLVSAQSPKSLTPEEELTEKIAKANTVDDIIEAISNFKFDIKARDGRVVEKETLIDSIIAYATEGNSIAAQYITNNYNIREKVKELRERQEKRPQR